jgi:hypothetical protein
MSEDCRFLSSGGVPDPNRVRKIRLKLNAPTETSLRKRSRAPGQCCSSPSEDSASSYEGFLAL